MDAEEHVDKILDILKSIPMHELAILTGGNGKGKSLIRKQMPFAVQKAFPDEISTEELPHICKSVSMQLRTESRPEFGALCNMMHDWPTTPTSVSTYDLIKNLFANAEQSSKKYYLIIDEPEIGMSRESQLGIAEYIRKQYLECKDKIYGMLLITHSESIVECLKEIGQFINLEGFSSAEEWLHRQVIPTDFELLAKESDALFLAVRDRSKPADKDDERDR